MKEHVLPAIRNMKDLEKLIQTDYKVCVFRYACRSFKKHYRVT